MGVLFHSWNLAVGKQRKTSIWPIALMYYYRRSAVFLQGFLYHTIKNHKKQVYALRFLFSPVDYPVDFAVLSIYLAKGFFDFFFIINLTG